MKIIKSRLQNRLDILIFVFDEQRSQYLSNDELTFRTRRILVLSVICFMHCLFVFFICCTNMVLPGIKTMGPIISVPTGAMSISAGAKCPQCPRLKKKTV